MCGEIIKERTLIQRLCWLAKKELNQAKKSRKKLLLREAFPEKGKKVEKNSNLIFKVGGTFVLVLLILSPNTSVSRVLITKIHNYSTFTGICAKNKGES